MAEKKRKTKQVSHSQTQPQQNIYYKNTEVVPMPEINPVTKDQLFEKKIAENTGSNYNVGDISDVVPVTKDQALLKEIALNSAGQSGDITELEGKVADNTGAIEAIVNEYGSKNLAPPRNQTGVYSGLSVTSNADGSVTLHAGTYTGADTLMFNTVQIDLKAGHYLCNGGVPHSMRDKVELSTNGWTAIYTEDVPIDSNSDFAFSFYIIVYAGAVLTEDLTFKPMIRDARITDPTYVPYAMTNRELTEKIAIKHIDLLSTNGYEIWEFFGLLVIILKDYSGNTLPIQTAAYGICSFYEATNKQNVHCNFVDNGIDSSNVTVSNESGTLISTYHIYGSCIIEGHLY